MSASELRIHTHSDCADRPAPSQTPLDHSPSTDMPSDGLEAVAQALPSSRLTPASNFPEDQPAGRRTTVRRRADCAIIETLKVDVARPQD